MKRKTTSTSKKAKSSRSTKKGSRGPNHAKLLRKHYLEPRLTQKKVADFDDENAVLREVAKALGEKPADLRIRRHGAPNGHGTAYEVTSGQREYYVMENQDEFYAAAVSGVESDLAENPEIFNTDFIRNHINMNKLRDELMSDVTDSNLESVQDDAERDPIKFLNDNSIDIPEPSEKEVQEWADACDKTAEDIAKLRSEDTESQWIDIGEEPKVKDSDIEEVAEDLAREQLRHPLEYLRDIYGDDATKRAIEIAGIDYKAAAEEAVSADGPEHFMCLYDGNYDETPSGFILWRHN